MNWQLLLFIIIGVITLGSGLMVVTVRNLIHMAMWLIVSLMGVAILFVTLSAGFLAVSQVIIYIGAISILLIFAIMLTRKIGREDRPSFNNNWRWALLVAVFAFAGILFILTSWSGLSTTMPELDSRANQVVELGVALINPNAYLLAFEIASILLLAALVGAIYVAWDRRKE